MDRSLARSIAVFLLLVLAVAAGGLLVDEVRHLDVPERATVTFSNESGELGSLDVRVAASFRERYVGLSWTDSLADDEGMLFVHDTPGTHTYVMRGMDFPIDIVFVAPNHTITRIHHASIDGDDSEEYRGYAKWVVEVPHEWTSRHDVDVGDRLRIEWPTD